MEPRKCHVVVFSRKRLQQGTVKHILFPEFVTDFRYSRKPIKMSLYSVCPYLMPRFYVFWQNLTDLFPARPIGTVSVTQASYESFFVTASKFIDRVAQRKGNFYGGERYSEAKQRLFCGSLIALFKCSHAFRVPLVDLLSRLCSTLWSNDRFRFNAFWNDARVIQKRAWWMPRVKHTCKEWESNVPAHGILEVWTVLFGRVLVLLDSWIATFRIW